MERQAEEGAVDPFAASERVVSLVQKNMTASVRTLRTHTRVYAHMPARSHVCGCPAITLIRHFKSLVLLLLPMRPRGRQALQFMCL